MKTIKKKAAVHLFASLTVILWALGYVMTRIAVRNFTTEAISFLRYFIAATALLAYAFLTRMRLPKAKDIPLFILGGAIGFAAYVYLLNEGSRTLTASAVSFLIAAAPVVTALFAHLFLKERIGVVGWISVGCAFFGVCVIAYFSGGFTFASGAIWICIATMLISVYNIFQRRLLVRYSPLEITTYCIVSGALLLSVFAAQSFPQFAGASAVEITAIIVLGVFSAAIAYLCWAHALSNAEQTSEVTNYMFITPILTTFLGFCIIGEAPHISAYIGGAFVLTGIVLANFRQGSPTSR
jgi:drug/metabolite transporter (DMT)-like permease